MTAALRFGLLGLLAVASAGCKKPAAESGGSIACYSAVQHFCEENPAPTAAQEEALKVMCSSGSGAFAKPAACPTAGFVGKCTVTAGTTITVRRYYPGVDAAYNQDFCVNTAHGVWSTAF
jgi:hypothetical protein